MNMYEDEHGEFIWAVEIDDSLHQQIYKEIKKFPITIVLCYISFIFFLLLGLFLVKYVYKNGIHSVAGALVGLVILLFVLFLSGGRAVSLHMEYRKFRKRRYKGYMRKVTEFLDYGNLLAEGFDKKIMYNIEQFARIYGDRIYEAVVGEGEYDDEYHDNEINIEDCDTGDIVAAVVEFDCALYAFPIKI